MAKNRQRKKNKFMLKFYLISAAWIFLSFLVLGVVSLTLITNHWWNDKMDMLEINSRRIASDYADAVFSEEDTSILNKLVLGKDMETISVSTEAEYFICNTDGKIVVCCEFLENNGSVCEKHRELVIKEELIEKAKDGEFTRFTSLDGSISDSFVVGIPIIHNGQIVGEVLAVEDAVTGLVPYAASTFKTILIAMIVTMAISSLGILIYSRNFTVPIGEMIEATDRYAKGDFSYHISLDAKQGRLGEMAVALNRMVDELKIDDEAKKSFVANVSHELKTPMTTISGFVDGILDGTIPPEKEREYLETVSTEVKRLSRLVVAMLNLSKIESGEVSINPAKYSISSQIVEALISMEQRIEEKHLSIEGLEKLEGVKVYADRDLLHQVVYNLLDNATKFTPENGYIRFSYKLDSEDISITIRNSGNGLSESEKSRIFERFYKVDSSRSFDVKGVGLGLYIVKTIINMHDGVISVSSEEGKYTEFTFSLPLYKE